MASIYTLSHPVTKQIRYVGQTNASLEMRLKNHLNSKTKTPTGLWIRDLKTNGLIPEIKLIQICEQADSGFLEIYWMEYFRVGGAPILNKSCNPPKGIRLRDYKQMKDAVKIKRGICQYNLNGGFIAMFFEINEACKSTNVSLTEMLNQLKTKKRKISMIKGKYTFKYAA